MPAIKITDDIYSIGVLNPHLRVFDIIMETKYGTSYNAYLIKGGEKLVLVETVHEKFFDEYMENIRHDDIFQMTGNAYLAFTPIEGLKFELTGAADYYDLDGQTYTFSRTQSSWSQGEGVNSSGGHNTQRTWNTLLQAVANYNKTFGLHSLGLMAGTSKEERNIGYSTNQTFNKPFPNDAITGSFDGSQLAVGTDIVTQFTSNRLVSVFGRA